jgi:uncharacterized HAD superfamily protein
MLDLPDKESRNRLDMNGKYKAEVYEKSKCVLFFESSLKEALEIKHITGKPIFCTENFSMINTNEWKIKKSMIATLKRNLLTHFPAVYNSLKKLKKCV